MDKVCESIVLANGTMIQNPSLKPIIQNATASPPPVKINMCADNDYNGKCGIVKAGVPIKNKCPDNDYNNICEWYLATDGMWYPQGDGPQNYEDGQPLAQAQPQAEVQTENGTSQNVTVEPIPLSDCETIAYNDGVFLNFKLFEGCEDEYEYGGYFVEGCMSINKPQAYCEALWMNTTQPQPQQTQTQVASDNLRCQPEDKMCIPGCEEIDMICAPSEEELVYPDEIPLSEANGTLPLIQDNIPPMRHEMVGWSRICSILQPALLSPCPSLVNSNGILTYEGSRAVGCIRNGAILAAAAGFNEIPLDWIVSGLQALEGPTGCSGIVNWKMLNQVGSTNTILDLIPLLPS